MEKTVHCNCKSGCKNRRCVCVKNNEPCDDKCGCKDCQNPLNGVDVENLTICAIQNIDIVKKLTEKELNEKWELPCECEKVSLKKLLNHYSCSKCEEVYWFSFCWNEVVSDSHTWHCEQCKTCRDWREWHCETCNTCSYGVSLPCDGCGAMSDLSIF